MIKRILLFIVSVPILIYSQNLNGSLSSSVYGFERFDSATDSEMNLRTFQTAALNFNSGKFSFRTRANFETNAINSLDGDSKFRIYNLYLEYRKLFDIATIKLGRQSHINGVGSGVYDGLDLKLSYSGISLSGFFGGNVPAYQKMEFTNDLKNDYILSGKLVFNNVKNLYLVFSYVDKNVKSENYYATRLDANFNPIRALIEKNSQQYQFVSGRATYTFNNVGDISARYDYDLNFSTSSLFELNANYTQLEKINFNVYYNYREPRISYNSIFSVFNYGNTQEIEGGLDYKISPVFTVTGKFGYVTYNDDTSQRFTIGVRSNYGTFSYRKTFGYAGELDAISVYGAKSFLDGFLTPSIGLSYTGYKLTEDEPRNTLLTLLAGVNVRPWKFLSFDLQGQYLSNKIYTNDLRIFAKVNYWFNTNF